MTFNAPKLMVIEIIEKNMDFKYSKNL